MKGKFITFEGCEGAGKSKQIKMLCDYLDKNGIKYVLTREPGGAEISEKIREVLLSVSSSGMTAKTEALLFAAARVQHVHDVIKPNLEKGLYVLCDRYIDSSFAYQAVANGLGFEYVSKINEVAINECMPDATVFLNISPIDAFKRKGGADKNDRIEQTGLEFHEKVYKGYLETLKRYGDRILSIDCSGERNQTHQNVINALKSKNII